MRISDWSSDVCSSDLPHDRDRLLRDLTAAGVSWRLTSGPLRLKRSRRHPQPRPDVANGGEQGECPGGERHENEAVGYPQQERKVDGAGELVGTGGVHRKREQPLPLQQVTHYTVTRA